MQDKHLESWNGKTVLITGGSSGIGFELASYINGVAKSIIIVSDDLSKLNNAKTVLFDKENHSNIYSLQCDVGVSQQVQNLVQKVITDVGCPNIIINNAGFAHYYTFDKMTMEDAEQTANVNFLGFLRVISGFLPHLINSDNKACIVNVASVAGAFPITPNAVYGASKAGMLAFSELLEIELKEFGIRVLSVCPGRVETSFFDHESYKNRKAGSETRIVTPIEKVVRGVTKAVALKRRLTFIPGYWRYFSWWINFDRLISRPLYRLFLSHRVLRTRR